MFLYLCWLGFHWQGCLFFFMFITTFLQYRRLWQVRNSNTINITHNTNLGFSEFNSIAHFLFERNKFNRWSVSKTHSNFITNYFSKRLFQIWQKIYIPSRKMFFFLLSLSTIKWVLRYSYHTALIEVLCHDHCKPFMILVKNALEEHF